MDKTLLHRSRTIFYRAQGASLPADASTAPAPLPLVLIHGFAEDGAIWNRQANHLKKNYFLVIPDLPGSGRSSPLPAATSMEGLADAIAAVLDAEKIEQCALVGHSMGGYIALAFVEKYPGRCKAFGLFHSTAYPDSEEKKNTRRKSIAFIRKHGAAEFIRQSTPNLFAESSRKQHPEWVSEITERYAGFDPDTLVHYYEAMIDRPDRAGVLKGSGLPTLFIIGSQDNTISLETSLQQSHIPALSDIHILDQAGHMGMLESTERCNQILDEFLSVIDSRSRYKP
jgi:pimeloyl-ACP methyl ester carboxylesterase